MKLTHCLAVLALAGATWHYWPTRGEQQDLLVDRMWVSERTTDPRHKISAVVFFSEESKVGDEIGLFVETSIYQGDYDAFKYGLEEQKLSLTMMQSNKKVKATYQATRCKEERDFDYCLELKGAPRGTTKYYSKKGMEIGSLEEALLQMNTLEQPLP